MLYEDARHRKLRHDVIYSKCIDKECTFKPRLVSKSPIHFRPGMSDKMLEALNKSLANAPKNNSITDIDEEPPQKKSKAHSKSIDSTAKQPYASRNTKALYLT